MPEYTSSSYLTTNTRNYTDIAKAIRSVNKTNSEYTPLQMAPAINAMRNLKPYYDCSVASTFSCLQDVKDFYDGPYPATFGNGFVAFGSNFKYGDVSPGNVKEWYRYGSTNTPGMTSNTLGYPVTLVYSGDPATSSVANNIFNKQVKFCEITGCTALKNCASTTNMSSWVLEEVSLPGIETIGQYFFQNCGALKSVSMPDAKQVLYSAFYGAGLLSVEGPQVTHMAKGAFQLNKNLTSVSFPKLETANGDTFKQCYALTSVQLPAIVSASTNMFASCSALEYVSMPLVTTIVTPFTNCKAIKQVNFDSLQNVSTIFQSNSTVETVRLGAVATLNAYAFQNCFALKNVEMSSLESVGSNAFNGCSALETLSLPNLKYLSVNVFQKCTNLKSLYFMSTEMVQHYSYSVVGLFSSANADLKIYVPASMLDAYKTANAKSCAWSSVASRFVGI